MAAVNFKVAGERDAPDEEEEGVEGIRGEHEEGRYGEGLADCSRNQVEEGQHSEDGNEHDIVDDGGIAASGVGDHVADQGHYEEGPEELGSVSGAVMV